MIYYFSGTGNARWVAHRLGDRVSMSVCSINEYLCGESKVNPFIDDKVYLVFPVHSWGPAMSIVEFIKRWDMRSYKKQPVYAVCVCGDDCGRTDKILRRVLERRGVSLTGVFSVRMPNNYILLPGFDVDSEAVVQTKIASAPDRIDRIVEAVKSGEMEHRLYHAGTFPALKSMIYPMFRWYATQSNSFYATADCVGCGKCVEICPTKTITQSSSGARPQWRKKGCVQCVACIHKCPCKAIEYGRITHRKGRYSGPDFADV